MKKQDIAHAVVARIRRAITTPVVCDGKYYRRFDSPESRLMFAVIEQAILDIHGMSSPDARDRRTALRFLCSDMPQAQVIGLDPEWIRDLLGKAGYAAFRKVA